MIIPAEGRIEFHFKRLVDEAGERIHITLPHNAEAHIVHVLTLHMQDYELLSRTVAEEYLLGMRVVGRAARRELCLRAGNFCLLFAGLFPEIIERRHVSPSYYVRMGRVSYDCAGVREPAHCKQFYTDLVQAFVPMTRVLREIKRMRDHVHTPELLFT